ncbi:hypothetical protein K503DRAFT_631957 [Rhizopogon vinicolor AM-OR11-026]|uniref:Uncharacterized protein n=1 Tax=Rhizopogon vinicolor AM-OR11-026 TaxID=1314800 RepID=A0A1B7MHW4_9AGAM|nr:hypothetical protein K503DRAFT_631957 [Rhizopogon vinicolor AM-OR11-026]
MVHVTITSTMDPHPSQVLPPPQAELEPVSFIPTPEALTRLLTSSADSLRILGLGKTPRMMEPVTPAAPLLRLWDYDDNLFCSACALHSKHLVMPEFHITSTHSAPLVCSWMPTFSEQQDQVSADSTYTVVEGEVQNEGCSR